MKNLKVGKIVNTHGLKGEIKIYPLTDYLERFEELEWIYIEGLEEKVYIENVKYKGNTAILKLKGYEDINIVEKFKGKYIKIDFGQRRNLPEDTYYISDIIGLDVYTIKQVYLGKVMDIIQAGTNEVYIIRGENNNKEILIPAVRQFVIDINLKEKKIIVDPIEGMIE